MRLMPRLACYLAALPVVAPALAQPADCPFALNGIGYFHFRDQPDALARARQKLDWLKQSGATWDRFDFWWHRVETRPVELATRGLADHFYSRAGVGMLPILCSKAQWMKDPPHTEQEIQQFAQYAHECVKRYKGRVK